MTWADACHEQVGGRVADHLRRVYPRNAEKQIARDFGVHEATAKGWLSGNAPANKHMTRLIARWGKSFLDFIYAPIIGAPDLDIRLERAITEMTAVHAEFRRLRDAESARRVARGLPPLAARKEHQPGDVPRSPS